MYTMDNDAMHQPVSQQPKQLRLIVQEVRRMQALVSGKHSSQGAQTVHHIFHTCRKKPPSL